MDTNENTRNDMPEEVIVLGVASIETQGGPGNEEAIGGTDTVGISEG